MSIKENVESLFGDAYEYLKRSIDGYKLLLVENLSLMLGDMLCGIVVFVLLLVAFFLVTGYGIFAACFTELGQ